MKPEEYIRNEVKSRGMKLKFLSDKANVRRRLAAAVSYGREPDPVEVGKEEFLTAELETLRGLQKRLRALEVDG